VARGSVYHIWSLYRYWYCKEKIDQTQLQWYLGQFLRARPGRFLGLTHAVQRSLQKVQGHRTAQGHRAEVNVEVTPPTGGPVGHPSNPGTLCDRSAQGSKSWHSGSFAKYSDIGLVTISFPACCVSDRATGLPVMVHDMHTRRTRLDYLQACPTGSPVDGVKSALTPALYLLQWPLCNYKNTRVPVFTASAALAKQSKDV